MKSRYKILYKRDPWKVNKVKAEYKECILKALKQKQFLVALFLLFNLKSAVVKTIDKRRGAFSNKSLFKYTMY